ncbi:hypothetical protein I3260_18745 [Photobacterium damselae]|uniref:hypothetical protein n=1 Tax=Gammaproteobacteria TaxID=1236 RepID=UPI001EE08EE0|nr:MULTISPECIES: hypothetical protein [Gammaproteobacteria]MCG3814276.1 hypothetical protein [Photobacterium damselae]MCG3880377.1 hypothetical protein [Psychrobacter sp. Ps6]
MNRAVLNYIVTSCPERIVELGEDNGVADTETSIRLARLLATGELILENLTAAQMYHYENAMRPLLENIPCDGVINSFMSEDDDLCTGNGFVDDESLLMSYETDDFRCQHCRHDANH